MENPSDLGPELVLLAVTVVALFVANVAALVFRSARAQCVGRELASERPRPLARRLAATFAAFTLAALILNWSAMPIPLVAPVFALSVTLLVLAPNLEQRSLGERGVSHGWHARAYRDLEEWRLTGEHLRWRLDGEWRACRVPRGEHESLRAELVRSCPERESPFKD